MSAPHHLHGNIDHGRREIRRDQQIEYLRSEAQRLRAALAVRERKIAQLETELRQLKETTE